MLLVAVAALAACTPDPAPPVRGEENPAPAKERSDDSIACVPPRILERVRRGYYPGRSGDVVMVEDSPNQLGTIHSTPWEFTQRVPLVLYGPGHVEERVSSSREVTLADIAPTMARMLGFDSFPERDGTVLREALTPGSGSPPRLIFTLVWDGGGTNVLQRWPDSWPNLRELQKRSTTYTNATVGSSPSVTPAVHATIGTGAFPDSHGMTDVKARLGDRVGDPWEGGSPRLLEQRTLADLWDEANDDAAEIGLIAHDFWHAGMIGHGSAISGDRDIAILDDLETATSYTTNEDYYTLPDYVPGTPALFDAMSAVDVRDGLADGLWLGHSLNASDGLIRAMPPWPIVQTDEIVEVLEREGFGADETTDLFFTNYKSTDLAGHAWNMEEPEVRDALEQQDAELARLVAVLDGIVGRGRYVLVLTADHGMAPYPTVRGGWAIDMPEVTKDVNRRFSPEGAEVVLANRGFQLFLDRAVLADAGHEPADVAAFLRGYTIRQNATEDVPDDAGAPVFLTALTESELRAAEACGA